MNRDGQADFLPVKDETLSLLKASEGASYFVEGAEIDTGEWDAITVIVTASRTITATDDIRFRPTSAETSGGTFADVPVEGILPTYKAPNHKVFEPNTGYLQAWGFVSNERFVKIRFNGVFLDTSNVDLTVHVIGHTLSKPAYTVNDPNAPSDSLP